MRTVLSVIVLLASIALAGAYPVNVTGNVSLNITDGNGTLVTPAGNASFNASENVSIQHVFNLSVEFPDRINLTVLLARGEQRNLSGYYDNLTLTCSNETSTVYVTNQTVNVTGSIKRGQTFEETNGACNVRVSCQGTCTAADTYEVNQTVGITKNGNLLTITSANNTKTFSIDVLNSSDTMLLSYFCPKDIQEVTNADNETQQELAYQFCIGQLPLITDFFNLTLNKCVDNWDAYRDFVRTHNEGVITANQELSDARSRVSSLETELELKNNRIHDLEAEVLQERDRTTGAYIVVAVLCFIVICCIVGLFIIKNGGDEVGS